MSREDVLKYSDWGAVGNTFVPQGFRQSLAPAVPAMQRIGRAAGHIAPIFANSPIVQAATLGGKVVKHLNNKYNNMSDMEKFWKFKAQPWLKDNWHMLAIPALFGLGGMALAGKDNKALGGALGAGLGLALKDQVKSWMDSGIQQFGNWTNKNLPAGTGAPSGQTAGNAAGNHNSNQNTGTTRT